MKPLRILQIGFHVEEEDFARWTAFDANPQNAARKLEGRYIRGYMENNAEVSVLSFFPATNFPGNKKIFFGTGYKRDKCCENYTAPFINVMLLKHLTRFLSCFFFILWWSLKEIGTKKNIVIYSVHSPFLVAACFARLFLGIHMYVIIPDLPSHMNFGQERGRLWKLFKAIDVHFLDKFLSKASGVSVVTQSMSKSSKNWCTVSAVVIEGMVEQTEKIIRKDHVSRKVFFYTGGLASEYGVAALLAAFDLLRKERDDIELWICGRGELSEKIEILANLHDEIKYFGYIPQKEIDILMCSVFCLVNCRNPLDEFVRYSFPSKLLEYLVSGVPILTTRLPGVPIEYEKYFNHIDGGSPEMIADAIRKMLSLPVDECNRKAEEGREFVLREKNSKVQVLKLLKLIREKEYYV